MLRLLIDKGLQVIDQNLKTLKSTNEFENKVE
jgi:hypothetical protein